LHFFLFPLCFISLLPLHPPFCTWRWLHVPELLCSEHPIGNMASSISSFLHTALTLLASITFHVNQSLPTPFPI
jgi:hypothetical protein